MPHIQTIAAPDGAARAIVVMGVSGSGKSTLATCLAERLGCAFLEGDDYHGAANVAKMQAGHPLTDDDRWPWLDRLGAAIGAEARANGTVVAACSALKQAYRARLEAAAGMTLRFVLLDGDPAVLADRMARRTGHYMPATLLDSQLATLERPVAGEQALTLDAARTPDALCNAALAWVSVTPRG